MTSNPTNSKLTDCDNAKKTNTDEMNTIIMTTANEHGVFSKIAGTGSLSIILSGRLEYKKMTLSIFDSFENDSLKEKVKIGHFLHIISISRI